MTTERKERGGGKDAWWGRIPKQRAQARGREINPDDSVTKSAECGAISHLSLCCYLSKDKYDYGEI